MPLVTNIGPFTLQYAINIANQAHYDQKDKGGQPYILHPLRVMLAMKDPASQMAAVLHDVVEDSSYTLDDLRNMGCPEMVVEAVDLLTKRPGEDYKVMLERIKNNVIATAVKIADLEDNLDLIRIKNRRNLQPKDMERLNKYYDAWSYLTGK